MASSKWIGGALGLGMCLVAGAASAATFMAYGEPGESTATVTNTTLITPHNPTGNCGATRTTSCNATHTDAGAIGIYRGTGEENPFSGTSEKAEGWYLSKLLNDSSVASANSTKSELDGTAGTGSSSFTILATELAGYAYLILKYDGGWAFLKLDGGNVTISGLPNGLSHWTAVTPVPAAVLLLLTALGGLAGFRWYQRDGAEKAGAAA